MNMRMVGTFSCSRVYPWQINYWSQVYEFQIYISTFSISLYLPSELSIIKQLSWPIKDVFFEEHCVLLPHWFLIVTNDRHN